MAQEGNYETWIRITESGVTEMGNWNVVVRILSDCEYVKSGVLLFEGYRVSQMFTFTCQNSSKQVVYYASWKPSNQIFTLPFKATAQKIHIIFYVLNTISEHSIYPYP